MLRTYSFMIPILINKISMNVKEEKILLHRVSRHDEFGEAPRLASAWKLRLGLKKINLCGSGEVRRLQ
jgi:hypothetical protein